MENQRADDAAALEEQEQMARYKREFDEARRFQLARDLLVAHTRASSFELELGEAGSSAGCELACRVAVRQADRLLELLAKPQEGGG